MGSLYRSERMSLCQLFLHSDVAYSAVAELGELGVVHFIDLNSERSSFQRRFLGDLKRCNLVAQKLKFIEGQILGDAISLPQRNDFIPAPPPSEMHEFEVEIEKIEELLLDNNRSMKSLLNNYAQLNEYMQCISKVQQLLTDAHQQQAKQSLLKAEEENSIPSIDTVRYKLSHLIASKGDSAIPNRKLSIFNRKELDISFIAGTVERHHSAALERLLWRTCGLNVFIRFATIDFNDDPLLNGMPSKDFFMVFFYGTMLGLRVKEICKCYQAKVYDCPDSVSQRALRVTNLFEHVTEIKTVIKETREYRDTLLRAAACKVHEWDIKLQKIHAVLRTMNMCDVIITKRYLIAECWIPTSEVLHVKNTLNAVDMEKNGDMVPSFLCEIKTNEVPPTYFRVNKFTKAFQKIVESYGIPTYREINPAPWTIITFPFLFAVMFGDTGHGLIMFFIALAFILLENEVEIDNEIMGAFYFGRYIILLMGLFSIYAGFIYNDFYSRSMNLFGSSWHNPYNISLLLQMSKKRDGEIRLKLSPEYAYDRDKGPYFFGLDPIWNLAENRLIFTNSMKMKVSIVFGILQMTFGVVLNLMNFLYFRSTIDIFVTFIPQILFLSCTFIYLCIQIIIKWLMFSSLPGNIFGFLYPGSHCAPSLLIGMINMFMLKPRKKGFWDHSLANELENCYLQEWYRNQGIVEKSLLILAVVCISAMLLVKPIYLKLTFRKIGDKEFSFVDTLMYQAVHTIEFALGCISHTASYLRLWALSVAHERLSEVLWLMVLNMTLSVSAWSGGPLLYLTCWFYGMLTFIILIMMGGLSAFLHALRLHWIEFQSKFYDGQGYLFRPFTFTGINPVKFVNTKARSSEFFI